jgi:hypothetical protein
MHGWPSDWIETAEELVCDEYQSRYEDKIGIPEEAGPNSGSEESHLARIDIEAALLTFIKFN